MRLAARIERLERRSRPISPLNSDADYRHGLESGQVDDRHVAWLHDAIGAIVHVDLFFSAIYLRCRPIRMAELLRERGMNSPRTVGALVLAHRADQVLDERLGEILASDRYTRSVRPTENFESAFPGAPGPVDMTAMFWVHSQLVRRVVGDANGVELRHRLDRLVDERDPRLINFSIDRPDAAIRDRFSRLVTPFETAMCEIDIPSQLAWAQSRLLVDGLRLFAVSDVTKEATEWELAIDAWRQAVEDASHAFDQYRW